MISLVWTKGLSGQEKSDIETLLKNNSPLIRRLNDIITKRLKEVETIEISKETYKNPSWPYLQADTNGFKRAMKEIQSLLTQGD